MGISLVELFYKYQMLGNIFSITSFSKPQDKS